jgi:hypothetical protein
MTRWQRFTFWLGGKVCDLGDWVAGLAVLSEQKAHKARWEREHRDDTRRLWR